MTQASAIFVGKYFSFDTPNSTTHNKWKLKLVVLKELKV